MIKNNQLKKINYLFIILLFTFCEANTKRVEDENISAIANKKEIKINRAEANKEQTLDKNFILGKFDYTVHSDFEILKSIHSSKTIYLNSKAYSAFVKMYNDASKNNIDLKVISGTRSFSEQKAIWERKWEKYANLDPIARAKKILEFSSMPSTSRHHWGTDIDLNNLNNSYFEEGKGKKEYEWLVSNANKYGFYQVYTSKDGGRTGYNLEKWHWSYLPLASKYLDFYNKNITYKDIDGFNGSELAEKTEMITRYVNGISEKAKEYKE